MIREGSSMLDPTKNMTPAAAKRHMERLKAQIEQSKARIQELENKRDELWNRISAKIEKEESYVQEAEMAMAILSDTFGEEGDGYDVDPDTVTKVVKRDGEYEIILYGTPMY